MFNSAKLYFPKFLSCVFLVGVGQKEVLLWDFEKGSKTATFLQFTYIVADLLSDLIGRSLQLGLEMTHLFLDPPLASLTPGPGGWVHLAKSLSHTFQFLQSIHAKKNQRQQGLVTGFCQFTWGPSLFLSIYICIYLPFSAVFPSTALIIQWVHEQKGYYNRDGGYLQDWQCGFPLTQPLLNVLWVKAGTHTVLHYGSMA